MLIDAIFHLDAIYVSLLSPNLVKLGTYILRSVDVCHTNSKLNFTVIILF